MQKALCEERFFREITLLRALQKETSLRGALATKQFSLLVRLWTASLPLGMTIQ
jgi:hypothetical protein